MIFDALSMMFDALQKQSPKPSTPDLLLRGHEDDAQFALSTTAGGPLVSSGGSDKNVSKTLSQRCHTSLSHACQSRDLKSLSSCMSTAILRGGVKTGLQSRHSRDCTMITYRLCPRSNLRCSQVLLWDLRDYEAGSLLKGGLQPASEQQPALGPRNKFTVSHLFYTFTTSS